MKLIITKEGLDVTERFFEAFNILKTQKRIKSVMSFTKRYGLNYRNFVNLRESYEGRRLPIEYLVYLSREYGVSAKWLLLGTGSFYENKLDNINFLTSLDPKLNI